MWSDPESMRELREEVREDKVLYYNMNTFYNWINHVLNEDLIDVVAQGSSQDQRGVKVY